MKFLNSIAAAAALAATIASYAGAEVKAGETLYGTVLKQVSVSGDLSHKDGRLLPTNAIEVLEVKDGVPVQLAGRNSSGSRLSSGAAKGNAGAVRQFAVSAVGCDAELCK